VPGLDRAAQQCLDFFQIFFDAGKPGDPLQPSLQLIQHFRQRALDPQPFLNLIPADKRIFSVFQKARVLMVADKPDE
jgi:hypothetical protein